MTHSAPHSTPRVLPRRLAAGSVIAVIAPAGASKPEALEQGIEALRSRGYQVRRGRHVTERYFQFGGDDRDRAADVMEAFLDPTVDAVWCVRGGVGCSRVLRYLDVPRLCQHPKIFVGYSDVTVLHLAIESEGGWPTFYGPMVETEIRRGLAPYAESELWRLLTETEPLGAVGDLAGPPAEMLAPGTAEGQLTGGTLALVEASLGTRWSLRAEGKIVVLEDVNEPAYRVDRMLTHLALSGAVDGAAGFVVGKLVDPSEPDGGPQLLSERQALLDNLGPLGKPILHGMHFGHVPSPLTIPLGCRARLLPTGRLEVLEAAVSP